MLVIKRIDNANEECARVIRDSFITVANEFGLTKENAPTNAAFIELDSLIGLQQKGARMYGGFCDGRLVGFVAVRKAKDDLYYMEKLAVLPGFRHRVWAAVSGFCREGCQGSRRQEDLHRDNKREYSP